VGERGKERGIVKNLGNIYFFCTTITISHTLFRSLASIDVMGIFKLDQNIVAHNNKEKLHMTFFFLFWLVVVESCCIYPLCLHNNLPIRK
jgi:hypothetical protein